MKNTFYTTKNNTIVTVEFDEVTESPRDTMDHYTTFVTFERDYISPDKTDFEDIEDFFKHFGIEYTGNISDIDKLVKKADKLGYILRPVYEYDHSGVSYSICDFNDHFDSGVVGFMYVKKSTLYEEYGVKRITKKILDIVQNVFSCECKEYTDWVNGDCYGIVEYDLNGNFIDSVYGIYGYDTVKDVLSDCYDIEKELGEYCTIGDCLFNYLKK